jgi:hypothetical protein
VDRLGLLRTRQVKHQFVAVQLQLCQARLLAAESLPRSYI